MSWDQVWIDVNLATMDPSVSAPYGAITNAAIAVKDGKIAWLGPRSELPAFDLTVQGGGGAGACGGCGNSASPRRHTTRVVRSTSARSLNSACTVLRMVDSTDIGITPELKR